MKRISPLLLAAVLVASASPSWGAWPGRNGRITFARSGSIYTVEPDGSQEVLLAQGANPAMSPDALRIVYSCDGQICLIDSDGSDQEQLTMDTSFRSQQPNWAPSGEQIVFTRRDLLDPERPAAFLYVIDVDGTNELALDEDGNDPVWSPDGRRIAFTKGNQGDGIYLIKPDGTSGKTLHKPGGFIHSLSWSPDARRLAFAWQRHNFWRVWIIRRDGSGAEEIFRGKGSRSTPTEVSGRGLSWSPDGKRILYHNLRKGELCKLRLTGKRAGCIGSGERPDWGVRLTS